MENQSSEKLNDPPKDVQKNQLRSLDEPGNVTQDSWVSKETIEKDAEMFGKYDIG